MSILNLGTAQSIFKFPKKNINDILKTSSTSRSLIMEKSANRVQINYYRQLYVSLGGLPSKSSVYPDTRRTRCCFKVFSTSFEYYVHQTSFERYGRQMDVERTLCINEILSPLFRRCGLMSCACQVHHIRNYSFTSSLL